MNITYDSTFVSGTEIMLGDFITSTLSNITDEYIVSTVEFRVQLVIPFNQTQLECIIVGLGNEETVISVNTSSKSYFFLPV